MCVSVINLKHSLGGEGQGFIQGDFDPPTRNLWGGYPPLFFANTKVKLNHEICHQGYYWRASEASETPSIDNAHAHNFM